MDFANNERFVCDVDAFVDNWPTYGSNLRKIVDIKVATDWDQPIENLLLLLHVFSSKKMLLSNAMEKLITFRVVSYITDYNVSNAFQFQFQFCFSSQVGTPPENMTESQNQHPYIVAYGLSKKEIILFYIAVERHLIPVSIHLDFHV